MLIQLELSEIRMLSRLTECLSVYLPIHLSFKQNQLHLYPLQITKLTVAIQIYWLNPISKSLLAPKLFTLGCCVMAWATVALLINIIYKHLINFRDLIICWVLTIDGPLSEQNSQPNKNKSINIVRVMSKKKASKEKRVERQE